MRKMVSGIHDGHRGSITSADRGTREKYQCSQTHRGSSNARSNYLPANGRSNEWMTSSKSGAMELGVFRVYFTGT
jgi:hypothetical protein